MEPTNNRSGVSKILISVVIFIALAYLFLKFTSPGVQVASHLPVQILTTEELNKANIQKTTANSEGLVPLPDGFPKEIPVEISNVKEGYKAGYPGRNITQYTVSYTSDKSRDSLFKLYSDFMKGDGYTLDTSSTSKSMGQISGKKGSNSLSVVISDHSGAALVQINYLER